MFNKELMLISPSKRAYEEPYIIPDRASSYIGYSVIPDFGSLKGELIPNTFLTSEIRCLVDDSSVNRIVVRLYPAIRGGFLYCIRKDTKKGFMLLVAEITSSQFIRYNTPLFSRSDEGKVIELYLSSTPPPFDWEDISE